MPSSVCRMLPEGATSAFSSGSGIYGELAAGAWQAGLTGLLVQGRRDNACMQPKHANAANACRHRASLGCPDFLPAGDWAASGEIDIAELRNQMQLVRGWCWACIQLRLEAAGPRKMSTCEGAL